MIVYLSPFLSASEALKFSIGSKTFTDRKFKISSFFVIGGLHFKAGRYLEMEAIIHPKKRNMEVEVIALSNCTLFPIKIISSTLRLQPAYSY